jgi:hypothetical protein
MLVSTYTYIFDYLFLLEEVLLGVVNSLTSTYLYILPMRNTNISLKWYLANYIELGLIINLPI